MNSTATFSVSKEGELDCKKMAEFLGRAGYNVDVSSNSTYLEGKGEKGCRLRMGSSRVKSVWESLKEKYGFECGHIKVESNYNGCILDYLAPSKCKTIKSEQIGDNLEVKVY